MAGHEGTKAASKPLQGYNRPGAKMASVPKFKSKICKKLESPSSMFSKIDESVLRFYKFEENITVGADIKKPYIIYLNEQKVKYATSKEKRAYAKNMVSLIFKIMVGIILLSLICFGILKLSKVVS